MRLGHSLVVAALLAGVAAPSAEATAGATVSVGLTNAYGSFIVQCPEVGYGSPGYPLDLTLSMQSFASLPASSLYLAVPDDGYVTSWSAVASISLKNGAPTSSVQLAITGGVGATPTILYTSPPGSQHDLFYSDDIALPNIPVTPGQSVALVMKSDLNTDPHSNASVGCVDIPARAPAHWDAWSSGGVETVDTQTSTTGQLLAFGAKVTLDLPEVDSVDASSGPASGGNSITISGNHMANPISVQVGGYNAAVTSASNTAITVTVPPKGSTGSSVPITVYTAGGKGTLATPYVYDGGSTPTPTPTVTPKPTATPTAGPSPTDTPAPTPAPTPIAPVDPGPSIPQAPQSQVLAPIPQPGPVIIPGGTITAVKTGVSSRHAITVGATVSPAGSLHAKATATVVGATGRAKKAFSFGTATVKATKAGKVSLQLTPSATATSDLKHHHLAVSIELTFTPTSGAAVTHTTTLTVK